VDSNRVNGSTDHDLLIQQRTYLEILMKDVRELKDDQRADHDGLDLRVRVLEAAYWKIIGGSIVAGALGGIIIKLFLK
jgi:hypothetical protein